jgi:hypothetical protein
MARTKNAATGSSSEMSASVPGSFVIP